MSERPLPYSQWLYVRAIANTENFGITVISLDQEVIAQSYYEGNKETPQYDEHEEYPNPSYTISIGTDFVGLIKGIKYKNDNFNGHTEVPKTTAPNFDYK